MQDLTTIEKQEIVEDVPFEMVITERFIEKLEKAASLYQSRYLPLCLKLTNSGDWINNGTVEEPRMFLQASGAEKLCNPLAINWDAPVVIKHDREDEKGKYYEYEICGIVKCGALSRWGWFTGNCSSRDQFFSARRSGFEEGDIRKAAFSNWIVNAVTRMAGIRNPNPDMLKAAGIEPGKVQKIEYNKKQSDDLISEAQGNRLRVILHKAQGTGEQLHAYLLSLKYDLKDVPQDKIYYVVRRREYEAVCKWAENPGPVEPKQEPKSQEMKPGEIYQGMLVGVAKIGMANNPDVQGRVNVTVGGRALTLYFMAPPAAFKGKTAAELKDVPCTFSYEIKGEGAQKQWFLMSLTLIANHYEHTLELITANGFLQPDIDDYLKAQHQTTLKECSPEVAAKLKQEIENGAVLHWMNENSSFTDDGRGE